MNQWGDIRLTIYEFPQIFMNQFLFVFMLIIVLIVFLLTLKRTVDRALIISVLFTLATSIGSLAYTLVGLGYVADELSTSFSTSYMFLFLAMISMAGIALFILYRKSKAKP